MIKWLNKKRNKKGFTLVELVVVIAILGVLSAIAVPRFAGTLNNSKVTADQASAKTIVSALNLAVAAGDATVDDTIVFKDAEADETNIAALVRLDYLETVPEMQSEEGDFVLSVDDDGDVLVTGEGEGDTQFYPVPEDPDEEE